MLVGVGSDEISQSCVKAKISTTEGSFLAQATVVLGQTAQNKIILISTGMSLNEPAIKITIDISCETQLHRDFLVLLDPPEFLPVILKNIASVDAKKNIIAERDIESSYTSTNLVEAPLNRSRNTNINTRAARKNNVKKTLEHASETVLKKIKPPKREKIPKDVLKLLDENIFEPRGLKISDTLSPPIEQQISENSEELRAAQRQMAAMLRDEKSDQTVGSERVLDSVEKQKIANEIALLKNQNRIDKANLDETRKTSYSRGWIVGLLGLIVASFLVITTLFVHIKRLQKRTELSWWDQGQEKKNVEHRKSIEELVDSVQASYGPVTNVFENSSSKTVTSVSNVISGAEVDVLNEELSVNKNQTYHQMQTSAYPLTLEETNSSTFNFFPSRGSSVKVEEISDVTQEAEFWMSVNDPQRAIEILDAQANVAHPDSPVPWLYLLDLYRLVKDKIKYDSLRDRFAIFFNANVPEYNVEPQQDGVLQLENYPHLIARICRTWNGNEIIPFLESLLVDDREGKRTGFDLPVYRDILLLISIAHELERIAAIEGPSSDWKELNNALASHDEAVNNKNNVDLGAIEFEVIDFPRKNQSKE
ncbi:MAG: hypothetical protein H7252_01895 [Cytophaga sp.]|nr:hypothetical protein [Undibacterium sp.]